MLWDEPKIFFLERRYFFSIILSEFLKNRVALHLFLRWKQEIQETHQTQEIPCDNLSACRVQIYNEILAEMKALAFGIQQAVSSATSHQKAI